MLPHSAVENRKYSLITDGVTAAAAAAGRADRFQDAFEVLIALDAHPKHGTVVDRWNARRSRIAVDRTVNCDAFQRTPAVRRCRRRRRRESNAIIITDYVRSPVGGPGIVVVGTGKQIANRRPVVPRAPIGPGLAVFHTIETALSVCRTGYPVDRIGQSTADVRHGGHCLVNGMETMNV